MFRILYRRQGSRPTLIKRNAKRKTGCLRKTYTLLRKKREAKGKGGKERCIHLNAEFQTIAKRDKKALLSDQCKEIEENNKWERLEIFSRKLELPREHFTQRWVQ